MAEDVVVAPDLALTPSWRDSLPADLKAEKSLESFKDVGALAKSYIATKAMVGTKAAVPGATATPEEIAAYRTALGVPATPEGYTIKPHQMMAHSEWSKDAQAAFLKLAHAEGLPPAAVEKVIHWYGDFIGAQVTSNQAMEAQARAALRTEWGANFEVFMGAANRGLSRVEQALQLDPGTLLEATRGTDPGVVAKAFHWIESQFLEDGFVAGESAGGMTREDAQAKLTAIDAALATVDPNSERARELVNDKYRYLAAAARAK